MPKDGQTLSQEVEQFLNEQAKKGFRLVTMFDPHGGYMKDLERDGEHPGPSRYKYRMQLHFVNPEDYSQSQADNVKKLFLANMASIEDFSEFEKELARQITNRLDNVQTDTKLQPASPEEIKLYLQSDNIEPTDKNIRDYYPESQTLPRPCFVSYNHEYTFQELFGTTKSTPDRNAVRDQSEENELKQVVPLQADLRRELKDLEDGGNNNNFSAGWKDWSGGITIRSGFVERNGHDVTYSAARSSELRFHELRVDTIRELCHDIKDDDPAKQEAMRAEFIQQNEEQLVKSIDWLSKNKADLNPIQIKQLCDDIVKFREQMELSPEQAETAGQVLRGELDIPVVDQVGEPDVADAEPARDPGVALSQLGEMLDAARDDKDKDSPADPESPKTGPRSTGGG